MHAAVCKAADRMLGMFASAVACRAVAGRSGAVVREQNRPHDLFGADRAAAIAALVATEWIPAVALDGIVRPDLDDARAWLKIEAGHKEDNEQVSLDAIETAIIGELRQGRRTHAELAAATKRDEKTVRNRVVKLRALGLVERSGTRAGDVLTPLGRRHAPGCEAGN